MDGRYPAFVPRLPWWGPDMQTLRNTLRGPAGLAGEGPAGLAGEAGAVELADAAAHPGERLHLSLGDDSGDRLAAWLQRPQSRSAPQSGLPGGRPPVVLVHGLGGDETSVYMQVTAGFWLERGHPVLRLNLRGAGPSRATCRFQYHAGRSADLRDALAAFAALAPDLTAGGMLLVGYSLGGNLVLKLVAELEKSVREEGSAGPLGAGLLAAASVSAPIDLEAASRRFLAPRNRLYQRHMLRRLKEEALAPGAEVSAAERRAALAASTLWDFDDHFVAPRGGFADARDYYAQSSALPLLDSIRVPSLAIHAADDPWIPAATYTARPWPDASGVRLLLSSGGGHVGFHLRGSRVPWHDLCIGRFFDEQLARANGVP